LPLSAPLCPPNDAAGYCRRLSAAGGGSYSLERYCLEGEKEARDSLRLMKPIEGRIHRYYDELVRAGEAAFSLYLYCVKNEMDAKEELGQ
jgi:hypothetical protein